MTALDDIPADVLDDEQQRTPAWEEYRKQAGDGNVGAIPRGTFDATLIEATPVRRRDGGWALRMMVRTDLLGRFLLAWRGLSEDSSDPYALTDSQVRGLRKFAESMGIPTPAPAQVIVEAVQALLGEPVQARVVHTPVGVQTTLSRPENAAQAAVASTSLVNGQAVDANGEVLAGSAADAFVAHAKLMHGLGAARLGLAQAAEGCNDLLTTEGWLALGFESLGEYLASPEVTLSRSEFYRLASIWKQYVLAGGVSPELLQGAGPSKLEVPLPALEQGVVSAEQAASDAESMTRRDLRAHYREMLGAPSSGGDPDDAPSDPDSSTGDTPDDSAESDIALVERALDESRGQFDGDELVTWAENYGHPEEWAKKAQDLHGKNERLQMEIAELRAAPPQTDMVHMLLAQDLAALLGRVLDEVGRPEQKRMGKELRATLQEALSRVVEHGLGDGHAEG